jgi:hypothetical protein
MPEIGLALLAAVPLIVTLPDTNSEPVGISEITRFCTALLPAFVALTV